ncbi:MAG: spondin domain-containing protein [Acidobacteriota bacterium]|nr:spondin domain-containing protein [Acidobacteriota bacterium]
MWPFRLNLVLTAVAVGFCWGAPVWAQSAGDDAASYRLTFRGTWTRSVTPGGVPGSAHFSPLIGAVHNNQVSFWEAGGTASPQLERVAELGLQRNLRTLMERNQHVLAVLEKTPRRGGTASTTIEFEATKQYPLVTLVTMIAPSPDWFVGISGRSLLDSQGRWLDELEVDLFPYDAGTEEGTEFSLDNAATVPQGTIASIRGVGKFTDRPMARLTFERFVPEPPVEPEEPGTDEPSPRFAGDVAAEPVGDSGVVVFWRGSWVEAARGLLSVEARSQTAGWVQVATAAATGGRVRIDGLRSETPYTFRLRAEGRQGFEYSEEASATTGGYSGPCRAGDSFLCLRQRFEVQVHWTDPDVAGRFGSGGAIPVTISDDAGLFWFFEPANLELVVKVLDGRVLNGHYWVFYGALSDVEYWVTVRDTVGGLNRTYHNPPKQVSGKRDLEAF